jgi:hypothetical protein
MGVNRSTTLLWRGAAPGRRPEAPFLETTDGVAILGYSGLGLTGHGTEPGDWMKRVLLGRNLPLEQSLGVLADAAQAKLPKHLESFLRVAARKHNIIIPAFVSGERRLYTIDLTRAQDRDEYSVRINRYIKDGDLPSRLGPPQVAIGGSGVLQLKGDGTFSRDLLNVVTAYDSGRISPQTVAGVFAQINHRVSQSNSDVSSRCIVAWRLRAGGGGHEFLVGGRREPNSSSEFIPTICHGMEVNSLVRAYWPFATDIMDALRRGETKEIDKDALNAQLETA